MIKTKMNFPLEDKLLGICAQLDATKKAKSTLEEALRGNIDWPYMLQESIKESITCLLYHNLFPFKRNIPKEIWSDIEKIYYVNAQRNIKIYQDVKTVLLFFNKEGLKLMPLKGIFLAEKVYNNIGLRAMGDIDLLVKKAQLPKINKLLQGLGYATPIQQRLRAYAIDKSYLSSLDYFKAAKDLLGLHIHWHIVNVTLPTYMYSKDIDMDRFWEYASPVELADTRTLQLAPHHLIIYLCEHALKHSFDRLILLSDIDAVIKKYKGVLDWQELIAEARNLAMERQTYYGLYFTKHFLGTDDIPDGVLSGLKPAKFGLFEGRFFNSVLNNKRSSKLSYFVYLAMVKGLMHKFRFVFRTLFPPPSVLALTFNLNKPRVTIKDYFSFLRKQFSHLKKLSN